MLGASPAIPRCWVRGQSAGAVRIGRFRADPELVERHNAGAFGGTDISFVAVAVKSALLIIQLERVEN
jgi:hypothetical protein